MRATNCIGFSRSGGEAGMTVFRRQNWLTVCPSYFSTTGSKQYRVLREKDGEVEEGSGRVQNRGGNERHVKTGLELGSWSIGKVIPLALGFLHPYNLFFQELLLSLKS